ncbi:hypothetical protein COU54_00185 [Candidatus Pacearchaeota archaeon CG10_big_fil_rev_8_21_14_0_10_31_24]|nr:MAG: hypothetical protein COU54_00185 [Candidatus Pacearchaeota archaeon CG10_big_fil_rev_8_21_14_0_10_31_24]
MGTIILSEQRVEDLTTLGKSEFQKTDPRIHTTRDLHASSKIDLYLLDFNGVTRANVYIYPLQPKTFSLSQTIVCMLDNSFSNIFPANIERVAEDVPVEELERRFSQEIKPLTTIFDTTYFNHRPIIIEHSYTAACLNYLHGVIRDLNLKED